MRSLGKMVVSLLVMLVASGSTLFGQTATGGVNGTVTDPAGAIVIAATVKLISQATNVETQVSTNENGYYRFVLVTPGIYILKVEMPGFKTALIPRFDVGVNQAVTQNITLTLGEVNQTVEVTAEAEMLQRSSVELGTVITEKAVNDLPLNGRHFTQLLTLSPGASPISTNQNQCCAGGEGAPGISGSAYSDPALHGQQNRSKIFFLDGIINTQSSGSYEQFLPNVDLIQEFKVQAHNDKAEYGGVMGGVINLVSKSGGNSFHGSVFEFVRNDAFDARNPFSDANRTSPPPFRQNMFGAAVGGPIIKNRTFFSGGYDGWRYSKPLQTVGFVPTDAMLNGDFSQYNRLIFNPYTTVTDASGNLVRDPFPNNIIPSNLISPAMQGFLKTYINRPNFQDSAGHNFILNAPTIDTANSWSVKVDHRLGGDNLFFRFSEQRTRHLDPLGEKTTSEAHATGRNWGGGWVHTFSPNLLLNVVGGVSLRPANASGTKHEAGTDPMKQLGFKDIDQYGGMLWGLASPWVFTPPGGSGEIGNSGFTPRENPNWNLAGDLSWTKGSHSFKMGAQYIHAGRLQLNQFQKFNFDDNVTANPQALGRTGDSIASALLGLPVNFNGVGSDSRIEFALATWAAYFQDEWKVNPKLTVNLGLRYDYLTMPKSFQPGMENGMDIDTQTWRLTGTALPPLCSAVNGASPCLPTPLADIPFGDHIKLIKDRSLIPTVKDNVGPRVGVAWQMSGKNVVRAGYGLVYDTLAARTQNAQMGQQFSGWPNSAGFIGTANALGAPLTSFANIQGAPRLPAPSPWQSVGWQSATDLKDGYSHQWNVEVQNQTTQNLLLSVAYVGSESRRLPYGGQNNTAKTPGPGSPAEVNQRRPVPWAGGSMFVLRSIGEANYHALQVKAQRRYANGLQSLLSYTWSKSIDTTSGWFAAAENTAGALQNYFDPQSSRGVSIYDVPHLFSWYAVYELPAGRGKRWLQSGPGSWILGNWQVNNILQARSGQPFNLSVVGDVANIGSDGRTYARPNLVGNPRPSIQTAAMWYNPAAFAIPSFQYGNFGRNVLRSDNVYNNDFSLFKSIPLGETRELQLRFEAFNVFNIMNLGRPGTTIGLSDAGKVTSVAVNPRSLQFGLKFYF